MPAGAGGGGARAEPAGAAGGGAALAAAAVARAALAGCGGPVACGVSRCRRGGRTLAAPVAISTMRLAHWFRSRGRLGPSRAKPRCEGQPPSGGDQPGALIALEQFDHAPDPYDWSALLSPLSPVP